MRQAFASEPAKNLIGRWECARGVDPFTSSENAQLARAAMKARARRGLYFKTSLFSDPAWDILLELFAVESEGRRLCISGVGSSADIPLTTALRWLNALQAEGLVAREDDPLDRRRSYLRLTDAGVRAMQQYFFDLEN